MASVTAQAASALKTPVYYLGGETWIAVNLSEASSPVRIAYSKQDARRGEFDSTPYQAASGGHRLEKIKSLVRAWVKNAG